MITKEVIERATTHRRHLHMYPEVSGEEVETTRYIREALEAMGLECWDLKSKTGVVAELGNGEGPTLALRADIDALPIVEQTGLDYASKNEGAMHACGHDFHTASLLGAVQVLKAQEDKLQGKVRFIFQPAEESNQGARALISEGVLEGVDAIIGFHNKPELPVGTIGVKEGPLMAAVGQFKAEITGVGTHAAAPHNGNDPIVTACQVIANAQAIVARHTSPLEPVVLSVSHIEAGNTWNVIPEKVFFEGTIRTFNKEVERQMTQQFEKMIVQTADVYGQKGSIEWILTPPVVHNDAAVTKVVKSVTEKFATVVTPEVTLGAEDFANYMEHVPGCFVFIGTGCPHEWHHPAFLVDDAALPFAIQYFVDNTNALLEVLSQKGNA
ncbi:amidohydrolase [Granulicatella adiacens]|uniref:amidohydrolase n=1 Tax=Granulicatella adiacens TaxID=46124 RepID=UPI0021D9C675|nr:amidohydrolase [Granulicatella adiacens]UXY41892.1 amidohydrolase [Granulicatella adiacens]